MTLACPECGAPAPRGAVAGRAYACPGCGNPVLPTEREARAPAAAAAPPPVESGRRRRTVGLALAAFFVLGAAYVGVYELLTAESKRELAELERIHGADVVTAPPPGARPAADDPAALRAWNATRDRYEVRTRHETLTSRTGWFFRGMLAAFAAQTLLTAWLAVKTLRAPSPRR